VSCLSVLYFVSARTNKSHHHQRHRAYVVCGLQPGAALVVVRLAVVTLPPCSTAPAVAGCRLVGCSVVSGRPLRSRSVAGVLQYVNVCLGPVLVSRAPSPPAADAADWRGRGRVPIAGWSLGGEQRWHPLGRQSMGPCHRTRRRRAIREATPWCLERKMFYFRSCEPYSTSNKPEY
jgi:hypothetical protein